MNRFRDGDGTMTTGNELKMLIAEADRFLPFMVKTPDNDTDTAVHWCQDHISRERYFESRLAAVRALDDDSVWTWIYGEYGNCRLFFFKDAITAVEFKLRFG